MLNDSWIVELQKSTRWQQEHRNNLVCFSAVGYNFSPHDGSVSMKTSYLSPLRSRDTVFES